MRLPPYLLRMKFENRRHTFALWIPLFLIGPIVLVLFLAILLILLPFALFEMLFAWRPGWSCTMLLKAPALLRLLCHLPGLKVDVEGSAGRVYIAFL
jgi:hypothetical protein